MKINKLKYVFVVLLGLLFNHVNAQMGMGKIEEIEQVTTRKLIVMIEEPREKTLKRIAKNPKRGSVEDYKADLKTFNENMKVVVEKFWPYKKDGIQYKTFNEIEALKKSNSKDYAVLVCLSSKPSSFNSGFIYSEGIHWVKDIKDDFEERDDLMFSAMMVNTIEDWGKKPVYYIPLFDVFPTKASLVYGIEGIENYFNFRIETKKNGAKARDEREKIEEDMKARAPQVANKTLLIREEWLGEGINAQNLKSFYPYKYQICDKETMDKIVMEQDGTYAYGVVLPYIISTSKANSVMYLQFVIDAKDSQTMCFVKPGMGGAMLSTNFGGSSGRANFTSKIFTKIVEQITGKAK